MANAVTREVMKCYRKGLFVGFERVRASLTTSGRKSTAQRKRQVHRGCCRRNISWAAIIIL